MPYIQVVTSLSLTAGQKEEIKADLGRMIELLPGKSESVLMIAFFDGTAMYHAGTDAPCAFIETRVFRESPMDAKKAYIAAVAKYFEDKLGIPVHRNNLCFQEFPNWGSKGEFK